MSQVIPYTGVMHKGNHESRQTTEEKMITLGMMQRQAEEGRCARCGQQEGRGMTAHNAALVRDARWQAETLEQYLQIPTFRRQGKRLSCR